MLNNPIFILSIIFILLCVFVLNWAVKSAYAGIGMYAFGLVNGLIFLAVIYLIIKMQKLKK